MFLGQVFGKAASSRCHELMLLSRAISCANLDNSECGMGLNVCKAVGAFGIPRGSKTSRKFPRRSTHRTTPPPPYGFLPSSPLHRYTWKWGDDNSLTYEQVFPVTKTHPKTGEKAWFNQIHAQHMTFYTNHPLFVNKPKTDTEGWPVDCSYGDGTPIPPAILDHIRETVCVHFAGLVFHWLMSQVVDSLMPCAASHFLCVPVAHGTGLTVGCTACSWCRVDWLSRVWGQGAWQGCLSGCPKGSTRLTLRTAIGGAPPPL